MLCDQIYKKGSIINNKYPIQYILKMNKYACVHFSAICSYSVYLLYIGWLAESSTILDRFYGLVNTTNASIGVEGEDGCSYKVTGVSLDLKT